MALTPHILRMVHTRLMVRTLRMVRMVRMVRMIRMLRILRMALTTTILIAQHPHIFAAKLCEVL